MFVQFFFQTLYVVKARGASLVIYTLLTVVFLKIYSVISPAEAVLTPDCGGEKLQLTHDATAAAAALRS